MHKFTPFSSGGEGISGFEEWVWVVGLGHGSWVMGHGSWVMGRESWVVAVLSGILIPGMVSYSSKKSI